MEATNKFKIGFFNRIIFIVCLVSLSINYSQAKWIEVSTDHFVIYSQQKESKVIETAQRLEKYHSSLNWLFKRQDVLPSPLNRLTIYVLKTRNKVRSLYNGDNKHVAAFYIGRSGRSIAFVSSIRKKNEGQSSSEQILLHEYAHHYLMSSTRKAYALWFNEGAAEFFSNVKFEKNGSLGLGLPAYNRKYDLSSGRVKAVPLTSLLDTSTYQANKSDRYDAFYGRSWLLFHMLVFSKDRSGQLDKYLQAIDDGETEINAANLAFGDLSLLDEELDAYQKLKVMSYVPIPEKYLQVSSFNVKTLSVGEQKAMDLRMRLKRGVDKEQLINILPKARKLLLQYPDDIGVLSVALEAEFDATLVGLNNASAQEAIALANRIIALDSENIFALRYKALSIEQILLHSKTSTWRWDQVYLLLQQAINLDDKNPLPLIEYFNTYKNRKINPTKEAISGLERALMLAPFDNNLRADVGYYYFNVHSYQKAIDTLKSLLGAAHDPKMRIWAKNIIEKSQTALE